MDSTFKPREWQLGVYRQEFYERLPELAYGSGNRPFYNFTLHPVPPPFATPNLPILEKDNSVRFYGFVSLVGLLRFGP